jgi:hypothetical protein
MSLVTSSHSGLFAEPPLSPTPLASAVEPPAAPAPTPAPAPLAAAPLAPAPVAPIGRVEPAPERRTDLPLEAQLVRMGLLTLEQLAEANRTRLENGGTVADIVVANGWVTPEQIAVLNGESPAPGPAPAAEAPAPIAEAPTPVAEAPAPIAEAPAPIAEAPAPIAEAPAPIAEAPAPIAEAPAPIAEAPMPAPAPEAPLLRVAEPEPEPEPEPVAPAAAAPAPLAPPTPIESHPVTVGPAAPVVTYSVALRLHGGERVDVLTGVDEGAAKARAKEIVSELTRVGPDEWPSYAGRFLRPDAILSVDVFQD